MDSRARGGDDRAVLEMWDELDMTTVARDSGLDQQEIRYEIIDGALVVNPPPGFSHEDWLAETLVQLRLQVLLTSPSSRPASSTSTPPSPTATR